MKRLQFLPVPVLATCLSALTLGNVYGGLGFPWVRNVIMILGTILVLAYILKMIFFSKVCIGEYQQTIPASLYAAFTMCLMILGSFYYEKGFGFGKVIWIIAVAIHLGHIIVFTVKHAIGNVYSKKNFVPMMPSWFVTYNGWLVACVTGGAMNAGPLLKIIAIYGCIIYIFLLPQMIWRLMTVEIKPPTYHTMAVMLAPCSLCVVALINAFGTPNIAIVGFMYVCVLCSLLFIIIKLPDFFSFDFYPGFAGLTFPMAIGTVASQKMAGYLNAAGKESLGFAVTQISGFQVLLTSMLVGYVVLMFVRLMLGVKKRSLG